MAVRGVWQLQKLIVCFCDHSGSSAGARDFVHRLLPQFQKLNPQFELSTHLVRGHHPHLRGLYCTTPSLPFLSFLSSLLMSASLFFLLG
jgi:large subunit ribosomal protein L43